MLRNRGRKRRKMQCRTISEIAILKASESNFEHGFLSIIVFNIFVNRKISPSNAWYIQKPYDTECSLTRRMVNLESVCDKVEKDNELGIWDENQDYGKILYFSSSRILVKKMGKRWSHRKSWISRKSYSLQKNNWKLTTQPALFCRTTGSGDHNG